MPHCGFVLSIFYEGPYQKLLENTSEFCLPGHLYYFRIPYEEITDFNSVNEYLRQHSLRHASLTWVTFKSLLLPPSLEKILLCLLIRISKEWCPASTPRCEAPSRRSGPAETKYVGSTKVAYSAHLHVKPRTKSPWVTEGLDVAVHPMPPFSTFPQVDSR